MIEYKKISSFDAAERLPQYRKDDAEEDILELINKQLVSIQGHLEAAALNTGHGILLILGVPRSGTTLLNQVLASRFGCRLLFQFNGSVLRGTCGWSFSSKRADR